MIQLNKNTQRAASVIRAYQGSTSTSLYDVYKNPSWNKEQAFYYCKDLKAAKRGSNMKIISHNDNVFSVGFTFNKVIKGITRKCLMYITKSFNYFIVMD